MRRLALLVVAAAMILVVPSGADAGLVLFLDDQMGNTVTIDDNGIGDMNPLVGVVNFNGPLGAGPWIVNVSTAVSKPLLGPRPTIDLNSVNLSGGTGTVVIMMTDTDFSFGAGPVSFTSAIGGTTDGTVSYSTWFDSFNAEFGLTTPLAVGGPFGPVAFSDTFNNAAVLGGLFSMTQAVQITHSSGFHISSFNAKLSIPEPGTLMLLGLGLLSLGFTSRRARRR
jgi:hypothetical protein